MNSSRWRFIHNFITLSAIKTHEHIPVWTELYSSLYTCIMSFTKVKDLLRRKQSYLDATSLVRAPVTPSKLMRRRENAEIIPNIFTFDYKCRRIDQESLKVLRSLMSFLWLIWVKRNSANHGDDRWPHGICSLIGNCRFINIIFIFYLWLYNGAFTLCWLVNSSRLKYTVTIAAEWIIIIINLN